MTDKLNDMISSFETIPFLFIGSGFSKRYFGLPDWTSLLKHMVEQFNDDSFAYRADEDKATFREHPYGLNPLIASFIEEDFNREWFKNEHIRRVDKEYTQKVLDGCSPFKAEMSYYLRENSKLKEEYKSEVSLLCKVAKKSIAGIITTNYDMFFETYLSEYKSYIGQQSLLFSQLQGIAEMLLTASDFNFYFLRYFLFSSYFRVRTFGFIAFSILWTIIEVFFIKQALKTK